MFESSGRLVQSAISLSSFVVAATNIARHSNSTSAQGYFETQHALSLIDELSDLEDGWAGPGSLAPNRNILEIAKAVASAPGFLALFPDISAMPNGTIAFDWEADSGSANLEIGADDFSFYLDLEGAFLPLSGSSRMIPALEIAEMVSHFFAPAAPVQRTRPVSYSDEHCSMALAYA
ncbi:hypothetical protein SAMN03159488_00654 [Pseudomonas sp. NFIX10]|jgi:hypothetical protein|uniref:hypothetical protein n=1 Tax=unclassified Pseudomonas TaxID=196821 RepID=UPI0008E5872D|nr:MULTISPECIES: hypothetical protein [unclassified Pseudomonas]SFA82650.1 hypothetical protein SAMN03159488_00654 [Pseudomonas sp. NFIX10]SFE20405.1 hypothetical protein SAMN03159367_00653 [Pseudomonas sp. NFACC06-1]